MSDLYKFGYTLDETIKTMRDVIDTGNHDRMFLDTYYWLKMLSEYREIGTVEECREAMEKQKPKKCAEDSCPDHTHYKCPSCGKIHMSRYKHGCPSLGRIPRFCEYCGQAIDENLEGMEDEHKKSIRSLGNAERLCK